MRIRKLLKVQNAVMAVDWVNFHTEGKMNLKQKKEYMAPEMEVVEMGYQMNLLEGSLGDVDPSAGNTSGSNDCFFNCGGTTDGELN